MTYQLQEFIDFLKTPFPHFFMVLSLAVSVILLTSDEFVPSLKYKIKKDEVIKVNIYDHNLDSGESKFIACYTNSGNSTGDVLNGFGKSAGSLVTFPAVIATNLFIAVLKIDYPNLSPETLETFAVFAFIYFNANFFLLLSYSLKSFHETCLENRPPPKPILNIKSVPSA